GSTRVGSRPKCRRMFSVPFGVRLTATTSASLMSSLASGPDRIGLDADVVPWPQATASPSASTVRTKHIPLRMALLSSIDGDGQCFPFPHSDKIVRKCHQLP